ncbi:hypothetical protein A6J80_03635 [Paracoccus yeei]|jgi:hypothetical protein|uniref:YIP1 family protein n=2 Tax=Paracoccus TaxID=265 RepID=A0A1V0GP61_9RHOB|nr:MULTISPECIES: hypothetical protein [Paracoccus]ARC35588.1 hypothetical protein A6J80_03635 [Paracoccus yeei]ATQ57271.1 hypothetical protein PYTT13_16680 [Paracoccus yeei]AWX92366.1 hypothetical protein DPM13_01485 [Paracoccus mutanolyticus]MBY0135446.1 hypothetical protein [Paracoccus yeei]OWJ93472.1 hypothetical protein CDV54_11755 [Paracoccus yeei]
MRSGIVPRIVESWWAPGRVVRGLRGMPDRGLIAILMGAMLMFLVAQAPEHARAAHLDPSVPLQARMGGALLAVMFIMPLLAYGVALIVAVLSRVTGRPVSPQDSRLALFWALLAVSPAMLLAGLTAGLVGPGAALGVTRAVAGIGFLVIWGAGLHAVTRMA